MEVGMERFGGRASGLMGHFSRCRIGQRDGCSHRAISGTAACSYERSTHPALRASAPPVVSFCVQRKKMRYVEGVAGTRQTVDPTLPQDALEAVRTGSDLRDVARRYGEPIAALQDEDWRPPEPILFAYY